MDRDAQQMICMGLMIMFIAFGMGSCQYMMDKGSVVVIEAKAAAEGVRNGGE